MRKNKEGRRKKKEIRRERKDLDLGKKREDILADLDKLCGASDADAWSTRSRDSICASGASAASRSHNSLFKTQYCQNPG